MEEEMKIVPDKGARMLSHKTGSLPPDVTPEQITERLGFPPNHVGSSDGKSTMEWSGRVDGEPFAIWDFKGSRWSTFGPVDKIFGGG